MVSVREAVEQEQGRREKDKETLEFAKKLAEALRHELAEGAIEVLPSKVYAALVDFEQAAQ